MDIQLRILSIHEEKSPEHIGNLSPNTVVCLDLEEFDTINAAETWVGDFYKARLQRQNFQQPETHFVMPCVAVLGATPLCNKEVDRLESNGAFFVQKPWGYTHDKNSLGIGELKRLLENTLAGEALPDSFPERNDMEEQEESLDLTPYTNPPYALKEKDFEEFILKRTRMPDDDPLKDD